MTVLVTGGAGFIGSHLAERLAADGRRVRVLDDLSTGSRANLVEGVEAVTGDVRDPATVLDALRDADVVYHLAALRSVTRSVHDPVHANDVNVGGTLTVLEAARRAGVRRVVYASSSSVYGDTAVLPKHEGLPTVPVSPYGVSKLAGEAYCRAFEHVYGLETVSLRFFNVFGPRQNPESEYAAVIPRFMAGMMAGEQPVVFDDGRQTREFTFVADVVSGCILAATAGQDAVGEAINVAGGGRISVLDLVALLNRVLGTDIAPRHEAPRPGDVRHTQADLHKAERLLGYHPAISLEEGLARTSAWLEALPSEIRRRAATVPVESGSS